MKTKTIVMLALLAFLAVSVGVLIYHELAPATLDDPAAVLAASSAPAPAAATAAPPAPRSRVVAYYFHGTSRCSSCLTIEKYSKDAIEAYFGAELQSGKLEFLAINVELPANEHYIQDYQLTTRSLVLASYEDDQQVRWENLPDVWLFLDLKQRFYDYVREGVAGFLSELG